jgi:hypothetical protein
VSLLSGGASSTSDQEATISPSGRDVFFVTSQGLSPQDSDGQADIYDARLGPGFPALPSPRKPCEGDACQGPLTNPAPVLVPGSASQAPGENLAPPAKAAPKKGKVDPGKKRRKRGHRRALHVHGRRKEAANASVYMPSQPERASVGPSDAGFELVGTLRRWPTGQPKT